MKICSLLLCCWVSCWSIVSAHRGAHSGYRSSQDDLHHDEKVPQVRRQWGGGEWGGNDGDGWGDDGDHGWRSNDDDRDSDWGNLGDGFFRGRNRDVGEKQPIEAPVVPVASASSTLRQTIAPSPEPNTPPARPAPPSPTSQRKVTIPAATLEPGPPGEATKTEITSVEEPTSTVADVEGGPESMANAAPPFQGSEGGSQSGTTSETGLAPEQAQHQVAQQTVQSETNSEAAPSSTPNSLTEDEKDTKTGPGWVVTSADFALGINDSQHRITCSRLSFFTFVLLVVYM